MKGEKQLFCCIFLDPGLVLFERAHSAKKMTENWYDKAKSGIIRNICTSSIFLHLDLFLKKNSNHMEGPKASFCDKPLRCSLQKNPGWCGSSHDLPNFSSCPHFPTPYPPDWRVIFMMQPSVYTTAERHLLLYIFYILYIYIICFYIYILYNLFSKIPHSDSTAHEWQRWSKAMSPSQGRCATYLCLSSKSDDFKLLCDSSQGHISYLLNYS